METLKRIYVIRQMGDEGSKKPLSPPLGLAEVAACNQQIN